MEMENKNIETVEEEINYMIPSEEVDEFEEDNNFGFGVAVGALATIAAIGIGKLAKKGYRYLKDKKSKTSDSDEPIDVEYEEVDESEEDDKKPEQNAKEK